MILLFPDTIAWDVSWSTKSRREVALSTGKVSLACVSVEDVGVRDQWRTNPWRF